jgi:hypothetical protein
MIVTKNEVQNSVNRLSKPKFNKRVERELALIDPNIPTQEPLRITPRVNSKPVSISVFDFLILDSLYFSFQ